MKKKFFALLLMVSMLSLLFAPAMQANDNITVLLNGNKLDFDVPPMIVDGRTLVPFRGILEALGAEVRYNNGYAYGSTIGKELVIPIGESYVQINYCTVTTDVPAQIVGGRTLVPLRVVSECLGANVNWEDVTKTITISAVEDTYLPWNDTLYYWGDVSDDGTTADGYGTLYFTEDNTVGCTGYFRNGIILHGKFYGYADKNTYYVGSLSKETFGKREGAGTMVYSDGSMMTGNWSNNMLNGFFIFDNALTGSIVTGNAVNGEWHGEITAKLKDGTIAKGLYDHGKLLSSNTDTAQNPPVNESNTHITPSVGGSLDIPYAFSTARYPLYLYSNDGKTFLGKLTTNKYDSDSIANQYGNYGSKYSHTSILNTYGTYGNKYNSQSAFNEYASSPPIIVDSSGNFIAYLTANKYKAPGVSYVKLLFILEKYRQ